MADTLTRDAIVATTRNIIRDDGLAAVSLRRVAGSLGVTAPALYAYVQDKGDLLRAVADTEFSALIERFELVTEPDPLERTRQYCRAYIDHALENPTLFKVMFVFQPQVGLGPPVGLDSESATKAFSLPAAAIDDAIAAGQLREQDPVIATLTSWIAMHGAAEVLLMGFQFDDEFREQLIVATLDMVIEGIRAR